MGSHSGVRISYDNRETAQISLKHFVIDTNALEMHGYCEKGDVFLTRLVSLHPEFILIEDRFKLGDCYESNEALEVSLDWVKASSSVKITQEVDKTYGVALLENRISTVKISKSYEHIETAIKESNIYLLEKSEATIVSRIEPCVDS